MTSSPQYGTTWWGRRWLDALQAVDYENRIPRGLAYAAEGKVQSLKIDPEAHAVKARVAGNFDPFYAVKLTLPAIAEEDVSRLIDEMAESPLIVARLAARELAPEISEICERLGIKIFPESWSDLGMSCSCPDWAVPCKHIAAVIYKLSEEIDANPFVLFQMRGIDLVAEMEKRGVQITRAVRTEMPLWSDLIAAGGRVPEEDPSAKWLENLEDLTFKPIDEKRQAILGLLSETPAGYAYGNLRGVANGVLEEAAALAKAQMSASIVRTIPEYDESRPLISLNTWGQAMVDASLVWSEKAPTGENLIVRLPGGPDAAPRALYEIFSGHLTTKMFLESPRELEALYDAWLIACRLVQKGAVMPQIYEPIEDFFLARWIPVVLIPEVRRITEGVGEAFAHVPVDFLRISGVRGPVDPLLLGELVLSLFIGSFVKKAAENRSADSGWVDADVHRALFSGKPVDTSEDPEAKAMGLRLESWTAPLYVEEFAAAEPILVVHDLWTLMEDRADEAGLLAKKKRVSATALEARPAREFEVEAGPTRPRRERGELEDDGIHDDEEKAECYSLPDFAKPGTDEFDEEKIKAMPIGMELMFRTEAPEEGGNAHRPQRTARIGTVPLQTILEDRRFRPVRFDCLRTVSRLSSYCPELADILKSSDSARAMTLEEATTLLADSIPKLEMLGVSVTLPRKLRNLLFPKPEMDIDLSKDWTGGFLNLREMLNWRWQVAIGDEVVSLDEFTELCKNAGRIVRFRDRYMMVSHDDVRTIRQKLAERSQVTKAAVLRAALAGDIEGAGVRLSDSVKSALKELTADEACEAPEKLNATLRPYQERGYRWMLKNLRVGMGSIIADDMGMGKTLQVISVLERLREDGELKEKKALVVVPTTLLTNWIREAARFAPELQVSLFYGTGRDLSLCTGHVILTTYGTLRTSQEELRRIPLRVMVIDEAQAIKNYRTNAFKAVRSMNPDGFIAMSGTPVENSLMEYWSVMEAANPGLLGTATSFKDEFALPIENDHSYEVAERFKRVTAPFIMRRMKTDKSIISDLPDKITTDEFCRLTKTQAALYRAVVRKNMKIVELADNAFVRRALVLQMVLQLKQICNSPAQFEPTAANLDPMASGKMRRLFDILDEMQAAGRKVLIFTQFVQMGNLLVDWIAERTGKKPQFLYGGLSPARRQEMVDRFQNRRDENIMILSLKAAGTGLNLTAASAVVHYDLWWNPAVENQATDRAYRIGQTSNVNVYRFICANTFEEKINEMIEKKKLIAEMTVSTGENWIGDLTNRELEEVFSLEDDAAAQ